MSRPRGRPRNYDRDAALDAAIGVFWAQGFAATSLDDLREATGMNRPSLYSAFGDKRRLFLSALDRFAQRMGAELGEALASKPSLGDGLQAFYFRAIDIYLSGEPGYRGCLVVTTASVETLRDDAVRAALEEVVVALDRLLADRFFQAEGSQGFDRAEAEQRGRLATAVLHSLSVRARSGQSRRSLRAFARQSVALLTR